MLALNINIGEAIRVGDVIVQVERANNRKVRLKIDAPRDHKIDRFTADAQCITPPAVREARKVAAAGGDA